MIHTNEDIPETIFISHASKDEKYVKELVSLLAPLNIPKIVCSSLYGYHIPNDEDIYDYLAENLYGNGRVVFILSENYYQSPACLNEMGACWILNKNYSTILTPNFSFEEIAGAVNPNQLSFRLDDSNRIAEFIEKIKGEFGATGLPPLEFANVVEQTVKNIEEISFDEKMGFQKIIWHVESCRLNDDQLELALRVINNSEDRIKLDSIILSFEDREGNTFNSKLENLNERLYKNENRLFHYSMNYEDSRYNPYNFVKQEVEVVNYVDAW